MTAMIMTYGRFNPPHKGHQLLVDRMKNFKVHYDRFIYISPTTGKNNPLDFETRHHLVSKAFGDSDIIVSDIQHKDIFAAVKWVSELGYSELHLVLGGDRVKELKKRLPMYNGTLYKFDSIHVYSAGNRDSSNGIEGMSASKMRDAAKLGHYEYFESGLPLKLRSMSRDIYERVRAACLSESLITT